MEVSQVNDEIRKYKLAGSVKGTITSKLIYTMLNDLANIKCEVQISVKRMSKTLKISEQAIRKSLKALEDKAISRYKICINQMVVTQQTSILLSEDWRYNMRKEDQLIEKAKDEYEAFIDELKLLDKGEIIDKAYEIVAKTDILALIQCETFTGKFRYTLRLDKPLSTIYSKWLETDSSEMDELRNTIDETVKR